MTKTILDIDTKAREIRTREGVTVEFLRVDGQWIGELQNYYEVPPDGMDGETFQLKMVKMWNDEIYRAVGFLVLAGTTLYGSRWVKPIALEMGLRASDIQQWVDREVPIIMSDDLWPALLEIMVKHRDAASEEATQGKITQAFEWIEAAFNEAKKAPVAVAAVAGNIVPFKGNQPPKPKLHVV